MDEITTEMLDDGVVKVIFDDPLRPVNTMTPDLLAEFEKKIVPLMADEAVKAMVFCSAKPDTFIAGADIKPFVEADDPDLVCELDGAYSRILTRLSRGKKPVVAAVHGAALGGGLEIVLACRYIVASDHPSTVSGRPLSLRGQPWNGRAGKGSGGPGSTGVRSLCAGADTEGYGQKW